VAQLVHAEEPTAAEYVPAPQLVQAEAPVNAMYVPAVQLSHPEEVDEYSARKNCFIRAFFKALHDALKTKCRDPVGHVLRPCY
jgi:hypothetical protein